MPALWVAVLAAWAWLAVASVALYKAVPHPDWTSASNPLPSGRSGQPIHGFLISSTGMWAQRIVAMDDIGWSSVGFENPNNRIEVQVRGRAEDAWQRIVRAVEPCAFRVEGGIVIRPLEEGIP